MLNHGITAASLVEIIGQRRLSFIQAMGMQCKKCHDGLKTRIVIGSEYKVMPVMEWVYDILQYIILDLESLRLLSVTLRC